MIARVGDMMAKKEKRTFRMDKSINYCGAVSSGHKVFLFRSNRC
jgi:hypothetical protein